MPERRTRRGLLRLGLSAPLFALDVPLASASTILAVRVWPAREYTRVTLEHDSKPVFSHAVLAGPDRLMVDLEGIQVDGPIRIICNSDIDPRDMETAAAAQAALRRSWCAGEPEAAPPPALPRYQASMTRWSAGGSRCGYCRIPPSA